MSAAAAATEATANGTTAAAEEGVKAASKVKALFNSASVLKVTGVAADAGVGFLGIAISGWGASVAVASFKHAVSLAKS